MAVNNVVTPHWEIFENPIVDDFSTEYEYTEINENNVNASQRLNYNFIFKELESWILQSDSYLYAKLKRTALDGTNVRNNDEAT